MALLSNRFRNPNAWRSAYLMAAIAAPVLPVSLIDDICIYARIEYRASNNRRRRRRGRGRRTRDTVRDLNAKLWM
jgi:hypothetical protein